MNCLVAVIITALIAGAFCYGVGWNYGRAAGIGWARMQIYGN